MASFTTRVELHSATSSDYEALHEAMADRGFSRDIQGESGAWYRLPSAEYDLVGDLSRRQVLNKAEAAIDEIGKTGMVLVTEAKGRTWRGLKKIG